MRIVVVEDNPTNLAVLCRLIGKMADIECQGFTSASLALAEMKLFQCDLAIVDYVMPEMNGLELIQAMRSSRGYAHVPVVMITADSDRQVRLDAIAAGATDFLAKPVDPVELRSRVANLLALRRAQTALADRAAQLSTEVEEATRHLRRREEEIVHRLARAVELRDGETGNHVGRVARIARIIAEELGQDEAFTRTLALAAPLHDIGKIGIPDTILNKPGRLDPNELAVMRRHVDIGADLLANGDSDLVQMAAIVAAGHHEHWNGAGYPRGLSGFAIPLPARITAIADVFDALCSERSYKKAWPLQEAREEIERCAGSHFDPVCVQAFLRGWPRIQAVMAPQPINSAA